MNDLTPFVFAATDPAMLGWPPTLAVEIALGEHPVREICEAYNIDRERWNQIRSNPAFVKELSMVVEALKIEGMGFKLKARLQSEELLKTSWNLIHAKETPDPVKADLIKFTIKAAGLDGSKDQAKMGVGSQNAFQINIHLG